MNALLLSTILASGLAVPAIGQSQPGSIAPPPVRRAIDENGVDVIRGTFNTRQPGLSIGASSAHGLSYQSENMGDGWVSSMRAGILQYGSTFIVTVGGESDSFTRSGGIYTATEANGATLTQSSVNLTYTSRNGTVVNFLQNISGSPYWDAGYARVTSIVQPNGQRTDFTYKVTSYCPGGLEGGICPSGNHNALRLQSVTSTNGYQLKFTYATNLLNDLNVGQEYTDWSRLANVRAINSAVEYCDPAADSCTLTGSWPALTINSAGLVNTVTDALNRVSTFTTTVDGGGVVTSRRVRRPGASSDNIIANFALFTGGYRTSSVTNEGVTYAYSYTDAGSQRTTTVTDPNGGVRTYVSDINTNRILSFKDELNRTTSYTYDSSGRLTRITAPEGNYVEYSYDARGNVTTTTNVAKADSGLADITTSASFSTSCTNAKICNQPNSSTDAKGNVTDYTYDATHGGLLTATAPAATSGGIRPQTRYTYGTRQAYYRNSSGSIVASGQNHNVVTQVSACQTMANCTGVADEVKTTVNWGPQTAGTANNLLPASVSSGNGTGTLTATTAYSFDSIGNLSTVDGPLSGTADTAKARYDAARQVIGVVAPDPDGAGARKHLAKRLTYNADGQVTNSEIGNVNSQSDPDWAAMTVSQNTTTSYDVNSRPAKAEAKSGGTSYAVSQTSYDTLGRVDCSVTRMDPAQWASQTDACVPQTSNVNTGSDRVGKTIYNAASEVSEVRVAVGTPEQATEKSLSYTSNGLVANVTDAENNRTTYEYDGFDRLSKMRYPNGVKGSLTSSTTDFEQMTYDANSNITQRRLRDAQLIGYSFDNLDRTTLKNLPGTEPDVTYTYDLLSRMTGASQTGNVLGFIYDALSRNTRQSGPRGNVNYTYDIGGRRLTTVYPGGTALTVNYDYDVTGNVTAIRENGATSGTGVLATYAYDDLGRRTTLTRGNGAVTSFGYDPVSRLSSLSHNLGGTANDVTTNFAYNAASQIDSLTKSIDAYAFTGLAAQDKVSAANGLNQLTAATPGVGQTSIPVLTHDARGNTTAIGASAYGYSSENLLTTGPASSTFAYDPALRLYEGVGGGTTVRRQYDGERLIAEYSGSNALQRRYVHGPGADEVLVHYEGSVLTNKRWLIADERGSIVAVTDSAGNATTINTYDEYGNPTPTNAAISAGGRFQYTGQTWLPELGMHYYKARIYNPSLGRFMQSDPVGYGDGMNIYNYVGSDPVNLIDPTGLTGQNRPDRPSRPNGVECPGICVNGSRTTFGSSNAAAALNSGSGRGGFTGGGGASGSWEPNSDTEQEAEDYNGETEIVVVAERRQRPKVFFGWPSSKNKDHHIDRHLTHLSESDRQRLLMLIRRTLRDKYEEGQSVDGRFVVEFEGLDYEFRSRYLQNEGIINVGTVFVR